MESIVPNLTLKPRALKFLGGGFCCLVGIAIEIADESERWWIRLPLVIACSLGFLIFIWSAVSRRMDLILSPAGFQYGSLRWKRFYRWSDIDRFFVRNFGVGEKICFAFVAGFQGEERVRRINQRFARFDKFLPDNYGKPTAELMRVLEEWRGRYGNNASLTEESKPLIFANRR